MTNKTLLKRTAEAQMTDLGHKFSINDWYQNSLNPSITCYMCGVRAALCDNRIVIIRPSDPQLKNIRYPDDYECFGLGGFTIKDLHTILEQEIKENRGNRTISIRVDELENSKEIARISVSLSDESSVFLDLLTKDR